MEPSRHFSRNRRPTLQDLVGQRCGSIGCYPLAITVLRVSHMATYTRVGSPSLRHRGISPEVRLTPLPVFLRRALDDQNRPRVFVGRLIENTVRLSLVPSRKALELRGLPYDAVI